MLGGIILYGLFAVGVLAVFLWPRGRHDDTTPPPTWEVPPPPKTKEE